MNRMPFKKRPTLFLDSCPESGDESSFIPGDVEHPCSIKYVASDDDELICTQRSTPKITKSMSPYGDTCPPDISTSADPVVGSARTEGAITRTKNPNVVTNEAKPNKFSHPERIEIFDSPAKKPSKLRLKLKVKRSSSQQKRKSKHNEEETLAVFDKKIKAQDEGGEDWTRINNDKVINEQQQEHESQVLNRNDTNFVEKIIANETTSLVFNLCKNDNRKCNEIQMPIQATPNDNGIKRKKRRKIGKQPSQSEMSNVDPSSVGSSAQDQKLLASVSRTPPKLKKKNKKKTFQQQVLLHTTTSMKPFTLKTLAADLGTTDTVLNNLMLSLLDKNIVRKKEFGKKVKKELYWVDFEKATNELYGNNLPTITEIERTKVELNAVLQEEKSLLEILRGMESELSNEELTKHIECGERALDEIKVKLKSAKVRIEEKKMRPEVKDAYQHNERVRFAKLGQPKKHKSRNQLNIEINGMRGEWKCRKDKCNDFIENLADALEKGSKEVHKMLEVETDEMTGVRIPPKKITC